MTMIVLIKDHYAQLALDSRDRRLGAVGAA
jgi:hypothetical protein